MQSQRVVAEKQSDSSSDPWAGWCLCRCCAGTGFLHTGRQILKVQLKEISIVPTKEAGAALERGNGWQIFSITRHPGEKSSGCSVSHVDSGPL